MATQTDTQYLIRSRAKGSEEWNNWGVRYSTKAQAQSKIESESAWARKSYDYQIEVITTIVTTTINKAVVGDFPAKVEPTFKLEYSDIVGDYGEWYKIATGLPTREDAWKLATDYDREEPGRYDFRVREEK